MTAMKTPSPEGEEPPKRKATAGTILASHTIRHHRWSYLHLSLLRQPPSADPIDALTSRKYLQASLTQFLGDTGAAIPIDILKTESQDVWIRVPTEDASAVNAAVSGWVSADGHVGWTVKGRDEWLGRLVAGTGEDVFG